MSINLQVPGANPRVRPIIGWIALQPDGKIVVAGSGGDPGRIMVARLLPNGESDLSFGSGGRVATQALTQDDPQDALD